MNFVEGIDCYSPKNCFREMLPVTLASEDEVELLLQMCDHRNLTTHVYDEEVSNEVFRKIPLYSKTMHEVLDRKKLK